MIPQTVLPCSVHPRPGELPRILAHYFTEADLPWIRLFYDEFLRMESRSKREVLERFRQKLPFDSPRKKREFLFHWLLRRSIRNAPPLPASRKAASIRSDLFAAAAESSQKPEQTPILSRFSERSGIPTEAILDAAFSDLAMERKLIGIPTDLSSEQIQLEANQAMVQGLLARSASLEIRARGSTRALIRQAKLKRLLCQVKQPPAEDSARLEVSGPLSIFGHTSIYGKAIAELVPVAAWCHSFHISARCRIRGRDGIFEIDSRAPLPPSNEPRRFDSRLEARFAKDFQAETSDWDLIREPDPIPVSGSPTTLIFPDFLIQHRRDPGRRWYMEIVGFWTQDYLREKMARLQAANLTHLILAVDRSLACTAQPDVPTDARIVLFRKKIVPSDILRLLGSA